VNPLLLPTSLAKRALDDLSEIADAARRLTSLESGVLGGLSRLEAQLGGLRGDLAPIGELSAVREAVEPLRGQLDALHAEMEGIEPLDEDMHAVRGSVDGLEPLIREVNQRLEQLDGHIETLREDLSPLGDLADKLPGVGRR
jgi:chromosome segregation ATPase